MILENKKMHNLLLICSLSITHTRYWSQEMALCYRITKFKIMHQSPVKTFGIIQ